jgi:hypothetical protein
MRSRLCAVAVLAAIAATGCGDGTSTPPTAPGAGGPGGGDTIVGLDVSCPSTLLIGQKGPCLAVARLSTGQTPVLPLEAAWSSTRSDVVGVDALGVVAGRSAGQASISASYRGRQATALVSVTEEDALRITAAAHQGEFRPGTVATMWLQGYYSVASAPGAKLSLRITDQNGTITTTTPLGVVKGGDFFLLSSTFTVPDASTQVCRTAILEVGSTTIAEPHSNESGLWCLPVRRD